MGEFPSGQREQTVNLSLFSFSGSNPLSPTKKKTRLNRQVFFVFIILFAVDSNHLISMKAIKNRKPTPSFE